MGCSCRSPAKTTNGETPDRQGRVRFFYLSKILKIHSYLPSLILRSRRRRRLEGWPRAPPSLPAMFEAPPAPAAGGAPQHEFRALPLGKELHVRLGLLQRAGVGRALLQAIEIRRDVRISGPKRRDLVEIEQRRRGGAVGDGERVTYRPMLCLHLLLDHAERGIGHCARFSDAMRVLLAFAPQPVADERLHRQMEIKVEEAVAQASLARLRAVLRNKTRLARIMLVEIFDDDGRLRHRLPGLARRA